MLAAMGYNQREINTAMQGLQLGSAKKQSTAVNTDPTEHTAIEQRIVEEYQAATDERFSAYIRNIQANGKNGVARFDFKPVSDRAARDILRITGVETKGNATQIEPRMVEHILRDHGKNGRTDHSMADVNDIARVQYVLDNYDDVTDGGTTKAYVTNKANGMPGQAKTVLFSKKVNGTYYVVEAVPDTKAKTVFVVSTYMQKEKPAVTQFAHATEAAPRVTSETSPTVPASNNTVPSPAPVVNTNSGSGIIWAGSQQTEGGINRAETEQSQQGVLGQEEAQPAAGGNAGQIREADADAGRTAPGQPAGTREAGTGVSDGSGGRDVGARARGTAGQLDEQARPRPLRSCEN